MSSRTGRRAQLGCRKVRKNLDGTYLNALLQGAAIRLNILADDSDQAQITALGSLRCRLLR